MPPVTVAAVRRRRGLALRCLLAFGALGVLSCGDSPPTSSSLIQLGAIAIDNGPRVLELGTRNTVTATTLDVDGDTVQVPVVWRSSNERVAVVERGGVLVALDTGVTVVTASSLGLTSSPVGFVVVWQGPAYVNAGTWSPPLALNPGAVLTDSVRIRVLSVDSVPVANAKVAFRVTEGGGSVSPFIATTNANGIAAAQWTIGPNLGKNVLTASVVRADSTLNPLVKDNLVSFAVNSYRALTVAGGSDQTGQILSSLPEPPSVRLVDSLGAPRPGVPVQFTAFSNGQVATPIISTNANGVASPGAWTLGDLPGEQLLEARVSDAKVTLRATATGTPIYYVPAEVTSGGFSTCARESDGSVKCWGEAPQNGSGGTANLSTPTAVPGSLLASSVSGGQTHYCALDAQGKAYCWGVNALVDTSGQTTDASSPTPLPSDIVWARMTTGFAHSCGIDIAQVAYCWGSNSSGQLGDLTATTRFVPGAVAGGFNFREIAAGSAHTCALAANSTAFCWGLNQFGQIGDQTTTTRTSPTAVDGGRTYQTIGSGISHSCALATQGTVYCWGKVGSTTQPTPVTFPGAPAFASASVGGSHACALTADGSAFCWGSNEWGQLGDSTTTLRDTPARVAGGLRFSQISAGTQHTCGRTTAGAVACWGLNRGGELGPNREPFHTVPRYVVLGVQP